MVQRTPLIQQLQEAWRKTIEGAYCQRLINSERGLQTYFCAALLEAFRDINQEHPFRVFIEPHFQGVKDGGSPCYPDVVICEAEKIVGVVELKYRPRNQLKLPNADLRKLTAIALKGHGLKLKIHRYWGQTKPVRYSLAEDAVLCWAGVYAGERIKLVLDLDETCKHPFLQLDVLTEKGCEPKICLE